MNQSPETPQSESENAYFATLPVEELMPQLLSKIQEYYDFAMRFKFLDRWRRTYLAYYGMSQSGTDTTKLNQAGTNGEEYVLKVNDFRSLVMGLLTMTTSQRPALQPKAMNTDSKSMNQTVLARTILDYYMTEKHLEETLKDTAEFGLIAGEGFTVLDWNATAGEEYAVDDSTGRMKYDGDLEFKSFHPIDVIRECWGENAKRTWFITREFVNKWDLAAKHQDKAAEIIKISGESDFEKKYSNISYTGHTNADHIPVFTFYHEKTEALPSGRMVKFCGADIDLTDVALPFKRIPVYRFSPAKWHGTGFGYTVAYDLLGIQTNLDALNSIVATGQMNYGLQNIMAPRGAEYNVVTLAQGLNLIEYDGKLGKPEPLNLLQTPKEILENIARLEAKLETLSGINSVARGDIDRDLSGAALALIASQAVQFNNGAQESYNFLLGDVGTGVVEILQEYATTPRIASIAGKSNRARVKEFKGSDLAGINRVAVEQVNPVSKTAAGRLQMAQDMLKTNLIKTSQQYFEVLMTGQLDSLYEHETSQMLHIRSENEDLSDGKGHRAMLTDNHVLHALEHATVLDSPDARSNPDIVTQVTAAIQEHLDIAKNPQVADILRFLGQNPIGGPPPGGPGGGPGGPAPGPGGPPHPPGPAIPQMGNATMPVVQQANGVKPPNMPNLPKGAPGSDADAYAQLKANSGQ